MRPLLRGGRCRLPFLPILLALALGGAAEPGIEGRYRLTGEQDVASEIVLLPDGRFVYGLAAGALDEHAEGRWARDGDTLHLTTEPKPVPPAFSEDAAEPGGAAPLSVKVANPDGRGIAGVDFRIGFAGGDTMEDYTQEDGWTMPAEEKRRPEWIELAVPMFGLTSPASPSTLREPTSFATC